jgi:hypothetical protein
VLGNNHISFTTSKIGSYMDVQNSKDPNGMRVFYYLIQDLKCLVFSIISLHFGDWGLGIGDWGLGPIPNPQSPIPNPQSPDNYLRK